MPASNKSPEKSILAERPLVDIVEPVIAEIRHLAELVDALHALPLPHFDGGAVDPEYIRQMQMIDRVNQRLDGLADFLGELRRAMPGDWQLDAAAALRVVKLHDLAVHLGLHDDNRSDAPDRTAEFHLF